MPVILTTGHATADTAISALTHKACDPISVESAKRRLAYFVGYDLHLRIIYLISNTQSSAPPSAGDCRGGIRDITYREGIMNTNRPRRFLHLLQFMMVLVFGITFSTRAGAATFTVTNTGDSGAGSLRQAIVDANALAGTDLIDFSIGTGVQTISPLSALPTITDPVIIDGTTQPGFLGTPIIELDGSNTVGAVNGLEITAGSSTVKALAINRFRNYGIRLRINGGNTVEGCFIGTDVTGTVVLGNGSGIFADGVPNNIIGGTAVGARNLISGNTFLGIVIEHSGATGNQVLGNLIGTDINGTVDLGNGAYGVGLFNAPNNIIGGTTSDARNIISGNGTTSTHGGILITETGSMENHILGNFIGIDISGSTALGNTNFGVNIQNGATNNTIGGTATGASNLISGNTLSGIELRTDANIVEGNFIGTDANGTADLGNNGNGIRIQVGSNNRIGGTASGASNLISGNNGAGIQVVGNSTGNLLQGNSIGTDVTGTVALGNSGAGVSISSPASNTTIGGTEPGARNVVSGNGFAQIVVFGGGTNLIQGNFVGTDVTGTVRLGLGNLVLQNSANNIVGGLVPEARNILQRMSIFGSSGTGNVVQGNFFGADVTGTVALENPVYVIGLSDATDNLIGGTEPGAGNIIAGGGLGGLIIETLGIFGGPAADNTVQGNFIGTDPTGTINLGNNGHGIEIDDNTSGNIIGGTASGAGNIIAHSEKDGVFVGSGTNNTILGNTIHSSGGLGIDLGTDGVTPNDSGDGDPGANNLQNFPVLSAVTASNITGSLNSAPNTTFRIEFFSNVACDASGFGEGENFLGATDVTTDGTGNVNFTATLSVGNGQFVAATATDPGNNTSEFSLCFQAPTNQPPITDAGSNQEVLVGGTVQLDGSGSSDPDGDPLTFNWEITLKPAGSTAVLSDPSAVNPEFVADVAGVYEIQLIVNDGDVDSDPDQVTITVLTPQQALELICAQLQDIVNNNPGTPLADKIEDAKAKTQTAVNELNKEPADNQAAIGNIEGAVGDLEVAVNAGLFDPEEGAQLMDQLAGIARQIAADALAQAIDGGGNPTIIAEAQQALADGDALRISGAFKDAINNYKVGLTKAESAAPMASKPALLGEDDEDTSKSYAFELEQNSPNPFNPITAIRYSLAEASRVRLTIYNMLGQEVRVLVDENQSPGVYSLQWDARDASGRTVSTGLYIYKLEAGANVALRKMVFVK